MFIPSQAPFDRIWTVCPLALALMACGGGSHGSQPVKTLAAPGPMPWADLAWGLAGIAGIGVCNFGVSFALALRTAIDARALDREGRAGLRRLLWVAFREDPLRFLGPPAVDGNGHR